MFWSLNDIGIQVIKKKNSFLEKLYILSVSNSCLQRLMSTLRDTWKTIVSNSHKLPWTTSLPNWRKLVKDTLTYKNLQSVSWRHWIQIMMDLSMPPNSAVSSALWISSLPSMKSIACLEDSIPMVMVKYQWKNSTTP